jgi:hypothetical protein
MKNLFQVLLGVSLAAVLAGCGGGDSAPGPSSPVPGAAPTAVIPNTQPAAAALATEAGNSFAAAQKMLAAGSLPGAVNLFTLPAGVETIGCPAGGNYSFTPPTSDAPGTTFTITFTNCAVVAGEVFNGTVTNRLDGFVSDTTFSFTTTYNLTYTGLEGAITGSMSCSVVNNVANCNFSDGTRTFETGFNYSNGTLSGDYQWEFQNLGTVKFTFNNWTSTTGSIIVTGANGTSATITHSGMDYIVTISGEPYTIPKP